MLSRLRIENLAVVENVDLELGPGLNVLTGSTGAGKSLIVGAVNLLLGEKAAADVIRQGTDDARVEATFTAIPAGLADVTAAGPDGVLTLSRTVSRTGRSHAAVNGRAVPVRELRALCARLIEPHGQNEQFRLRHPESHVEYVDALAAHEPLRTRYADALALFRSASAELERFDAEMARLRERRELYLHRIEEVERVAPCPGEKAELDARARLMVNAEKLHAALDEVCGALYDEDTAAAGLIGRARRLLSSIAPVDERAAKLDEALAQAESLVSDTSSEARSIRDALDFEPADVERVQARLDALTRLERRYHTTIEAIIAEQEGWTREIAALEDAGEERALRMREVEHAAKLVADAGSALSTSRTSAAAKMDRLVTGALQETGMPGAWLRTDVTRTADAGSAVMIDGRGVAVFEDGLDTVRMRVRTNPGEAEGALEAIASTGELSRVALALKQIVASGLPGATLVFDEIDAGVGADLGAVLAEKLLALASRHQIVCITHMPQIAARGTSHLVVLKETDGDRTRVRVRAVVDDERRREIARMLGGEEGSERRLALATELLGDRKRGRSGTRVRP